MKRYTLKNTCHHCEAINGKYSIHLHLRDHRKHYRLLLLPLQTTTYIPRPLLRRHLSRHHRALYLKVLQHAKLMGVKGVVGAHC